jgi:hypothetical protein
VLHGNRPELRHPDRIALPARPDDIDLGDSFVFPFVSIESVLPLDGTRRLAINDKHDPFSTGRNPQQLDDTEFIVRLDALRPDR